MLKIVSFFFFFFFWCIYQQDQVSQHLNEEFCFLKLGIAQKNDLSFGVKIANSIKIFCCNTSKLFLSCLLRHKTVTLEYSDFSLYRLRNEFSLKKASKRSSIECSPLLFSSHQSAAVNSKSIIVFHKGHRALGQPCLTSRTRVTVYTGTGCTQVMSSI